MWEKMIGCSCVRSQGCALTSCFAAQRSGALALWSGECRAGQAWVG